MLRRLITVAEYPVPRLSVVTKSSNINSASLSLLPYFQSLSWLTDATIVLAHIRGQVGAEEFHLPMSSTHEGFPSLWLVWLGEIQQQTGKDSSSRGPHCGVMRVAPTPSIPLQSPPVSRFWKLSTVLALTLSRARCPVFNCHLPPSCLWVLNSVFLNCPLMSPQSHTICPCWNAECLSSA